MSFFIWESSYCTGDDSLDNNNYSLLKGFSDLLIAINDFETSEVILKQFDELHIQVFKYFEYEERIMFDNLYPGYASHKNLHTDFLEKIKKIIQDYYTVHNQKKDNAYANVKACADLTGELASWLDDHIEKLDKEIVNWINERTK